jgi:hypothetical protein
MYKCATEVEIRQRSKAHAPFVHKPWLKDVTRTILESEWLRGIGVQLVVFETFRWLRLELAACSKMSLDGWQRVRPGVETGRIQEP